MHEDPRAIIAREPMRRLQIIGVILTVLLNALDGFDVLSISFALPGIAAEWGTTRAALGVVLSMELIGMGVGSVLVGNLADRIGRRPTTLGCLVVMALGMGLASTADNAVSLSAYRLFTGLGIGGMLAAINAFAAELSNARFKNMMVTLMAAGYPLGAVIGGTVATRLIAGGDWRLVFEFGAIVTVCFIPLVFFLMPETVAYLVHRRGPNVIDQVNRTLLRLGHMTIAGIPELAPNTPKAGFRQLFAPGLARTTILLIVAYFMHCLTFYLLLKWGPKMVVDLGYTAAQGGGLLVWTNVGGLLGSLAFSVLVGRFPLRNLLIGTLVAGALMVCAFGSVGNDLATLSLVAGISGFFTNAGVVGLYAIFAQAFPTAVRAGGTGLVIGLGRAGAALSPVAAGLLMQAGAGLGVVTLLIGCGSIVAAVTIAMLRHQDHGAGV